MKIAIHHREGSFSERWIEYCKNKHIEFKIVNCNDSNIIEQLKDCDALMWHHHHGVHKDVLSAKSILFSLEHAGIKVFPDFNTAWHFDDKVAQKYLLEAINAPLVPSYVFYDKEEDLTWADQTSFPKVFKLKGGAGSANVKLARTKKECKKLIRKSFGKGFKQFDGKANFLDSINKYKSGSKNLKQVVKAFGRIFISTEFSKKSPSEKGYVYFQEFIPNNDSDTRVIVIGEKAFAIKRMTRENDFRASGSGNIIFDKNQIDERCVQISFDVNNKLKCQSVAYDFVFDENNNPLIVEISYGFAMDAYDACPGYWDSSLQWHEGKFNPQGWMVEDLINNSKI